MLRANFKKNDFEKFEQEKSMITSPKINDKIELFHFIRDAYFGNSEKVVSFGNFEEEKPVQLF